MKLLGVTCIVLFVLLAIYLGGWVMFVGGIVQIIGSFQGQGMIDGAGLAIGILRVIFAAFSGWATFMIGMVIGGLFFLKRRDD